MDSLLETVFSRADEQYNCRVLSTGKDCDTVSVDSLSGPIAMREVCFKYFTTFLKEHICCELINKIIHLVTTNINWLRHYHLVSKKKSRVTVRKAVCSLSDYEQNKMFAFRGFYTSVVSIFLLLPANVYTCDSLS